MRTLRTWLTALLAPLLLCGAGAPARHLSFDRRVEAEKAIQRVDHAHQIGATRSFEEEVPRALLEKRVRTYLKLSAALEKLWNTRVTGQMLQAEAERMARETRMPARLRELHAALDDDPLLILECLVRPVLVERLARGFFEADRARAGGTTWDDWWRSVEGDLDETSVGIAEPVPRALPAPAGRTDSWDPAEATSSTGFSAQSPGCVPADLWTSGRLDDPRLAQRRTDHTAVWTGSLMIVWGGTADYRPIGNGFRYNPATDAYTPVASSGEPTPRSGHTAVWGGGRMIVWGGRDAAGITNTGGIYNPVANSWIATPTTGAPAARAGHTAVWAVSMMIVWGGKGGGGLDTGGRFNLFAGWTATTTSGAPSARSGHTAVWDGSRMLVWGGQDATGLTGGGAGYDPAGDMWIPLSQVDAPSPRTWHKAIWTGDMMVVWGGVGSSGDLNTGGRYDPTTDTWSATSTSGAPTARRDHTAAWDGGGMTVWGGFASTSGWLGSGGRYDPYADLWAPTSSGNAPSARSGHTAIWTGSRMLIWGGRGGYGDEETGGKYDPVADAWAPTPIAESRPSPREGHAAVWTGSRMIVWGGVDGYRYPGDGGRYDPATDTWSPIATTGAPGSAYKVTAVWTGREMIVLPGSPGGRYDPLADTWSAISTVNAPPGGGTAVWTGTLMVVWNGPSSSARYHPETDAWLPVSPIGAPAGWGGSAVWTGREMIVWGGQVTGSPYPEVTNTGSRYDPIADTWAPISTVGAPQARAGHVALWTGDRMLIWGGGYQVIDVIYETADGGLYDPAADTWQPTTLTGAPGHTFDAAAVWTGSRMLVWGGRRYAYLFGCCYPWEFDYAGTGAIFDPASNTWSPLASAGGLEARARHTGIWTGESLILWGGMNCSVLSQSCWDLDTGGLYGSDPSPDADGDGFGSACDCDDGNPQVRPGGAQICGDGLNNDCANAAWPSLDGTNEADADGDGVTACAGDCDDSSAAVHPGAPELCDDRSNDCSNPGWPVPPEDLDRDGRTTCAGGTGDCNDADPVVWAPPGEAQDLLFNLYYDTFSWQPPVSPGAVVVVYDLIRSESPADFGAGAVCLASDTASLYTSDPETPGPDQIRYYLVRSQNGCPPPNQSLGADSAGTPRAGRDCP